MKHLVTHARSPYRRLAGALNGVLALIAFVFVFLVPGPPQKVELLAPSHPLRAGSAQTIRDWYFRTGQWRADAQTLVAVAKWCFDASPALNPSNPPYLNPALPNTNSAAVSRT